MRRMALSFFLAWASILGVLAQTPETFQSVLGAVLARHGATALQGTAARLSGQITYAGTQPAPFTLILQNRSSRFEVDKAEGKLVVVRQDQRVQATRGGRREAPERSQLYGSGINLSPVFALLALQADARFAGSVVRTAEGGLGLRYDEAGRAGQPPPVFKQPRQTVVFWLDENRQIQAISYVPNEETNVTFSYRYSYPAGVSAGFRQPNGVVFSTGDHLLWSAQVNEVVTHVTIPANVLNIIRPGQED